MNEKGKTDQNESGESDDLALARLLEIAGVRTNPPQEMTAAIRDVVQAEWQAKVRRRVQLRRGAWLAAVAAGVVLAVGAGLTLRQTADNAPGRALAQVASIERVTGGVATRSATGAWRTLRPASVSGGDSVRTESDGRIALLTDTGYSVRLDHDTQLVFLSARRLRLQAGRVYVDSGGTDDVIEVVTPHGTVRDIGTQFEVLVGGADTRVRVRSGLIRLSADSGAHEATAGEELSLDTAGATARRPVAPHGEAWGWVESIAPEFRTDGATLAQFLRWTARETGRSLEFADAASERIAGETRLRGSTPDLSPAQALDAVMATTGMNYRLTGGTLLVTR